MADGPSLREIKKLLDSPAVSDEVKRGLVSGYTNQHWDRADGLRPYADRLGMAHGLLPGQFGFPGGDLDKALDQAHRQIDKHDAESGQQALGENSTGAANSNSILDHGEPGLRYFQYLVPLYQKCVSGSDISVEKARQLYDEQRDMNFAALRADGDTLTKSATKLSEEITTQRNAWNTIDQLWTGQGAEAATSYVGGYLGQARTVQSQMDKFAKVLSRAPDALEQAVHDKAKFVAGLYADTVGGKSPAQIEEIIYYAQHGPDVLSSLPQAARIVHMFGMSAGPSAGNLLSIALGPVLGPVFGASSAASDLLEKAKLCATNFVDNVFIPDVEAKWRGFVEVCTATDKSVREIYRPVMAESNSINGHPFTAATTTLPPVIPPGAPAPKPTGHDQTTSTSANQSSGGGAGGVPTQPGGGQPPTPQPQASTPVPPVAPPSWAPANSAPTPSGAALSGSLPAAADIPGKSTPTPTPMPIPGSQGAAPSYLSGLSEPAVTPGAGTATEPAPSNGVAWLRDPSTLPPGWTINPSTAELTPPAPDVTAASPGAPPVAPDSVLTEPPPMTGPGAPPAAGATVPPGETPPSITITDGNRTLTVAAETGGAQGIDITVTDPAGSVSRYTVEMGDNGLPQLTADPPPPADLTATADGPAPESGPAGSTMTDGPVADGSAQLSGGVEATPVTADRSSAPLAPTIDAAGSEPPLDLAAASDFAGSSDSAPADQPGAADAPTEEPVQVRAASAVGWSEAAGGTTNAGAAAAPAGSAPDTVTHGGSPSMGHADVAPGVTSALGSADSSQMSGLHGDLFPTPPALSPGDQWLLEGTSGGDTEWSSLASVLAGEQGRSPADTGVAAWSDKPEEQAP